MYTFDWLDKRQKLSPNKIALVDVKANRQWTYKQFNERASRFGEFIRDEWRIKKGERIAILAYNSSNYMEVLYGCAKVGVILVCLNWRLAIPELEYIIKDCTPRSLIYDLDFKKAAYALKENDSLEKLMVFSDIASKGEWIYEHALANSSDKPIVMLPRKLDDIWHLLYTSGTTGRPKGVIQTFGMVFYNAVNIGLGSDLTSEDVTLNLLPFFHTGGLNLYTNPSIHVGATALILKSFEPSQTLKLLSEVATLMFAVPAVYRYLSQHPDFEKTDFSRMREWECGGEKIPLSLLNFYQDHGIIIKQGYGMTETGPTVFLIDKEHAISKRGSVGKPMMHVEVRCVDSNGNDLSPGQRGELLIRGPGVTSGYWNQPEKTVEVIDKNGWLHSGDVVEFDEDYYYYIVDRIKDMYISGGENVYPAEIEHILDQLPQINEVAVIGTSDEKWGEVGKVIAVLKPEEELTEEEIIEFLQGKIARYKIPKSVEFVDQLPRNQAGKILKTVLRKKFGS